MLKLEDHPLKKGHKLILPIDLPAKILELPKQDKLSITKGGFDLVHIKAIKQSELQFVAYLKDNIPFACSYILNINPFPFQMVLLEQMFKKRFIIMVMSRGSGKTWISAAYAILRAALYPYEQIICISLTFRQIIEGIFRYIEKFWNDSPILQELAPKGVKHWHDRHVIEIGTSRIVGLPLGEGGSTRGMRATCTLVDEAGSVPKSVLDIVIRGFSVVSSDPMEKAIQAAEIEELLEAGVPKEEVAKYYSERFNQIIQMGTATYQFNPFYEQYFQYMNIIEHGHNKKKLMEILKNRIDEEDLKYIDSNDFMVAKMPYTKLPENFIEIKNIIQNKALMDSSQFAAEYECVTSDFLVHCVDCFKYIPQVNEGDLVITHDGSFRAVSKKFSRLYKGPMILISTGGNTWASVEYFTVGHPIYTKEGFKKSEDLRIGDYLCYPIKRPVVECNEFWGQSLGNELLRILGRYLACGQIIMRKKGPMAAWINMEFKAAYELRDDIEKVFGCKALVKKSGDQAHKNVYVIEPSVVKGFCEDIGEALHRFKLPKALTNLPNEKSEVMLSAFIKCVDKEEDIHGVKVVIENIELALTIADLFLRNNILTRTYRRAGHTMEFETTTGRKETYVPPRVIMRFVGPSDLIHICEDYLYTKITGLDRRNETHTVFNLEVDGPEHSFAGPAIIAGNCHFPADSDGFYKRTLIESCKKDYGVELVGNKHNQYVLALDPARAIDRAGFVLIKLGFGEANQVVYVWSTREDEIREEEIPDLEKHANKEGRKRYYKILADKIRNLCERFNVVRVVIDSGGGGDKVKEELQDPPQGVLPILDMEDETLIAYKGQRILKMQNWTADWIAAANHRMRANMEQKRLVFPKFGMINVNKLLEKVDGDDTDRIIYEIEELINELTSIVVSQTQSGVKEKFGLPKRVAALGEQRVAEWKDRYAALLMAHFEATEMIKPNLELEYRFCGGSLDQIADKFGIGTEKYSGRVHSDMGQLGNQILY